MVLTETEKRLARLEGRADTHDEAIDGVKDRLTRVELDLTAHSKRSDERHTEILGKLSKLEDGIHISPKWVPLILGMLFGGSALGNFGSNLLAPPTAAAAAP